MTRLEWVQRKGWYDLVDHDERDESINPTWKVSYRSSNRGKDWQIMYPHDSSYNHGLLQSEVPEDQLRRNLEMEYLLTREV